MAALELATLAVSAAGVIVTAVGIIIAILALWGYNDILKKASEAAVREGLKKIDIISPEIEKRILEKISDKLELITSVDLRDNNK